MTANGWFAKKEVIGNFVIKSFPSCFPKKANKILTEKYTCDKAAYNTGGSSQRLCIMWMQSLCNYQ